MYKILGKKVAENPGIAKRESQRRDSFTGIMVVAFKREGIKIKRYKEVLKTASGNQGRRVAISLIKRMKPGYIAVMRFDLAHSPEIIMEKGDRRLVDEFLSS